MTDVFIHGVDQVTRVGGRLIGCFWMPFLLVGLLLPAAILVQLAGVVVLGWPASVDDRLITDRWEAVTALLPALGIAVVIGGGWVVMFFGVRYLSQHGSRFAIGLRKRPWDPVPREGPPPEIPAGSQVNCRFEFVTLRGERVQGRDVVRARASRTEELAEPVLYDPSRPADARLLDGGTLRVGRTSAGGWSAVLGLGPAVRAAVFVAVLTLAFAGLAISLLSASR